MKRILKFVAAAIALLFVAGGGYGAYGYCSARSDAGELRKKADALIANNLGGSSLGEERYEQLLMVQDPQFEQHSGVDLSTPGAGLTTVSQSLAKRVGFENFTPGVGKIYQTGYALELEYELTKEQIMALWLDTLEMGRGPDGWVTGFHRMSEAIYGVPPNEIEQDQYLALLAVLIAPSRYEVGTSDSALDERVSRISRLVSGSCKPLDNADVWLEDCGQ